MPLVHRTLLVLALLLAGCDTTTASEHLDRARVRYDDGDYRTAVIELKNALQKDPDLAEARLLLGESHNMLGDYPSALKEFERALDLGVTGHELQVGLLTAKNRLGRHQEVIGELEGSGALSPELAAVLADAYLAGGDLDRARPLYEQALTIAPGNLGLGIIAWRQGDPERARGYLSRAVTLDPQSRDAWLRLGEFELAQRSLDAARGAFETATSTPGGALPGNLGLVRVALAEGDLDTASGNLVEALRLAPRLPVSHYLDALIKFQQDDIDGAEAALREVQRTDPNDPPSLYLMGLVKAKQEQFSQAEDSLRRFLAVDPDNVSAAKMLAAVYTQTAEKAAAEGADPGARAQGFASVVETLGPFAETTTDPQLLAMLGTNQLHMGDVEGATRNLQRAVELAPDSAVFRNQLALSLMLEGDSEGAEVELESAVDVNGDQLQSDYLLTMLRLKGRDFDGAGTAVEELIRKSPDNPLGFNLRGAVQLGTGDMEGARASFEHALEIDPAYFPAARNLAGLDLQQGDLAAARQRYERFLEAAPNNAAAMVALADVMARSGDLPGAHKQLRAAVSAEPKSPVPRLALARLLMMGGKLDAAAEQAQTAAENSPRLPSALLMSAVLDLRRDDVAQARARAEALQALAAEGVRGFETQLGVLQVRTGMLTLARTNLETALRTNPENVTALRELARIDLQERRPELARERLVAISRLEPDNPETRALEADVLRGEGRLDEALAAYQGLAGAGVREGVVGSMLIEINSDDTGSALQTADTWLSANPDDRGIRLLKADALLRREDYRAAIAEYEGLDSAEDPVVLNNLAWLYMETGDERALETALRAQELAPENAEIADTVGWILVQEERPEDAIEHLKLSVQLNPRNPTVQYHLGVAQRAAGDKAAAVEAFEAAVALGDFPEKDVSQRALAELKGS